MPPEVLEDGALLPFTAAEHTTSVNSLPPTFGQLNADGMFPAEGLPSAYVRINIQGGVIRALPTTPGGRPSTIAGHDKPKGFIFEIPNISHEDSVMANDIRDILALARRSRDYDDTLATLVERRHTKNRRKFDITLELMRMSALQGKIIDGAGTELYDLYEVFGLQEKVVYFDLDNANTNIADKVEEVIGLIEDANTDETVAGVEARVSKTFFSKFISHPKFEKFFLNTPAAAQLMIDMRRSQDGQWRPRTFDAGGLFLKETRARLTMWDGEQRRFIAEGEGHAYPTGTTETQATYAAPPLDVRELDGNAAGVDDLIHITTELMKHGMGEEWKYQMNALPIWARPNLLVKLDDGPTP